MRYKTGDTVTLNRELRLLNDTIIPAGTTGVVTLVLHHLHLYRVNFPKATGVLVGDGDLVKAMN